MDAGPSFVPLALWMAAPSDMMIKQVYRGEPDAGQVLDRAACCGTVGEEDPDP
jgi:hypothetical protein